MIIYGLIGLAIVFSGIIGFTSLILWYKFDTSSHSGGHPGYFFLCVFCLGCILGCVTFAYQVHIQENINVVGNSCSDNSK